jgi:hypothetical protein
MKTNNLLSIFYYFFIFLFCSIKSINAQCDNTNQYPTSIISLSEGVNTITYTQWAGDYNVTTNYVNSAFCTYASSVTTDYITLRRASDNIIIATGLTPLTISYQDSMGNIEMHLNTNSSCGVQNTDRITTVTMFNLYKGGIDDGFTQSGYEQCDGKVTRWLGYISIDWHKESNWECSLLPNSTSDVIIPSEANFFPTVFIDDEIHSLLMKPGSSINILAKLTLNGQ